MPPGSCYCATALLTFYYQQAQSLKALHFNYVELPHVRIECTNLQVRRRNLNTVLHRIP